MTSSSPRPLTTDAAALQGALPSDTALGAVDTPAFTFRLGMLVAATWVLLDHATKEMAVRLLSPAGSTRVEFPGFFSFELTYNSGGAWSTPAPSWFFLAVTVIVTVVVVRALLEGTTRLQAVAYGLLLAGAIGNALDRVFRTGDPGDPRYGHGHVVDFIASARFPTFNVADIAITFGFILLVITAYAHDRAERDSSEAPRGAPSEAPRDGPSTGALG